MKFNIHNNRELGLLQIILCECKHDKAYSDDYTINKINGMLCACFTLGMLLEPIKITTLDDVIKLRMILQSYLTIWYQRHGMKIFFE